ncbi:MAG TPA: ABC transporter substrate-binding protein, partial [Defluviicoccus sp.]|nr:ABC transporter substrate-binding protein [Defluviicoccus sp.]
MTRRSWTAVALLIVAAAATALIARHYPEIIPGAAVAKKDAVKIAQVGEFFVYMPLYYAKDRGFFDTENLDIAIINTGGDEKSVAAVISGDATFGVGDPTFAAIAGQKGRDVRVVASVLNGVPFWGVAKNPNVPEITSPGQLKGFTVGTFPAPSTAYTLQARMFRQGGLEPSIRQAQFGTLLPLLESGQVDIVLELEPNVSIATSRGAHVVFSMAKHYGQF